MYNIFFHPLRHYPGPLLARATRLYHLYYDLSGAQHLKQKEWHDQYGEVVRVAPDELSYNSAQAWVDICGMCPETQSNAGFSLLYSTLMKGKAALAIDQAASKRIPSFLATLTENIGLTLSWLMKRTIAA